MHIELVTMVYSPSDLTLYMESPFASLMEHLACIDSSFLEHLDKEDPSPI